MEHNPLDVIAECLGLPAHEMRSPANADYLCPFVDRTCIKLNHESTAPMPVCSIYRTPSSKKTTVPTSAPVCLCPLRFFEAEIVNDVVSNCWVGPKPVSVRVAREVKMEKFGQVDLVIADLNELNKTVNSFLPVELQAVDITGSYLPYYEALIESKKLVQKKSYGFNWANVRKRFVTQLISKGIHCHKWGTRIVAVVQDTLFEKFAAHASIPESTLKDSNIVFMLYRYERGAATEPWSLKLSRVVPTTHAALMSAALYETTPEKSTFEAKIIERIAD